LDLQRAVIRHGDAGGAAMRGLAAPHRHAGGVQGLKITAPVLVQERLCRRPRSAHGSPRARRYLPEPERLNQVSKSIAPRRGPGPGTSVVSSSSAPK
ncbi:hypothetical protein MyNCGM70_58160, partial [Achromobacter xylosoxidans]